ncbi:MAG: type 1 glutamine amidotransferase, partial [Actinomycetes bacterium]
PNQAFRVGPAGYGLQFHIETSPATVLSWARCDPGGIPSWQLDSDHLEQVHADMAEVWGQLAARFVALAASELAVAGSGAVGLGDRPVLPLVGH